MSRILAIAFACVALGSAISADVYVVTNNIDAITNASASLTFDRQQTARLTVHARLGPFSLPLNLATNYTVRWEWTDQRDGIMVINPTGRVVDGSAGLVSAGASLFNLDLGATYDVQMWAYQHGVRSHLLAWHLATLTQSVAAGGASVSVSITTTANVTVAESGTGNVVTGVTAAGSSVTVHRGTVMGGGGDVTINGMTTNNITIAPLFPLVGSNVNGTIYIGFTSLDGGLVTIPFTNTATIDYTGTTQTYVVGVSGSSSQMIAHVWGAGPGGVISSGSGGYSEALFAVTNGELLYVVVGQGGQFVTGGVSGIVATDRAFGGGGRGVSRGTSSAFGGAGGYSGVFRSDMTPIVIAGGAGGGGGNQSGSAGGGISGAGAFGSFNSGGGGTQTDGGQTVAGAAILAFTNTAGSYLQGGDGGAITNLAVSGNATAGGGGGGYYGGGGGYQTGSTPATGGGGSGYINPTQVVFGTTFRGATPVPASESPYYPVRSPAVGAGGAATHLSRGGNGAVVLRYP